MAPIAPGGTGAATGLIPLSAQPRIDAVVDGDIARDVICAKMPLIPQREIDLGWPLPSYEDPRN